MSKVLVIKHIPGTSVERAEIMSNYKEGAEQSLLSQADFYYQYQVRAVYVYKDGRIGECLYRKAD